ncbi:MAG: hypothetical protein N2747_11490, partial [Chitinophagaceae bacterium]|nr:hypothetical protein [Chitinophagaceae bacterium]
MVRISPGNTLATLCLLFLFGCTSSIPGVNNPPQQHHLRGPLNVFTTPENPFHENQIIPANAHVESDTGFVHFIYQTIKEATGAKASLTTGPH